MPALLDADDNVAIIPWKAYSGVNDLFVCGGILLKGPVFSSLLRPAMLVMLHWGDEGVRRSKVRVSESVCWRGTAGDTTFPVAKCASTQ